MNDASDILIPTEKLHEGFVRCSLHIQSLLESADILFQQNLFSSSLSLSILSQEEVTKLHLIHTHLKQKSGIDNNDWKEITRSAGVHKKKLLNALLDYVSILRTSSLDTPESQHVLSQVPGILENTAKLNRVKHDCLYLNWEFSDWFNYNRLSKIQIKAFAYVELINAKFLYFIELRSRHADFLVNVIDPDNEKTSADLSDDDLELLNSNPYNLIVRNIQLEMKTSLFCGSAATMRHILNVFYTEYDDQRKDTVSKWRREIR
jgi:AbiV family abortive infection protein